MCVCGREEEKEARGRKIVGGREKEETKEMEGRRMEGKGRK